MLTYPIKQGANTVLATTAALSERKARPAGAAAATLSPGGDSVWEQHLTGPAEACTDQAVTAPLPQRYNGLRLQLWKFGF